MRGRSISNKGKISSLIVVKERSLERSETSRGTKYIVYECHPESQKKIPFFLYCSTVAYLDIFPAGLVVTGRGNNHLKGKIP